MQETVASRAERMFGMTEREYLFARIAAGWTARQIAAEVGLSHVAVTKRLHRIARRNKPWTPMGKVAA